MRRENSRIDKLGRNVPPGLKTGSHRKDRESRQMDINVLCEI